MADLTKQTAGAVNVAANWDLGVVPGSADIARIGTNKTSDVPSGYTFDVQQLFLTPTAGLTALTNNGTLKFGDPATLITGLTMTPSAATAVPALINNGTVIARGNVSQGNTPYQYNGSSITEFDRTCAHGGSIVWNNGAANSQSNAWLKSSGTSAAKRAEIRSSTLGSNPNGRFTLGSFFGGVGQHKIQFTNLRRLGASATDALMWAADTSSANFVLEDCLIDSCGRINSTLNRNAAATISVKRNVFKNSLGTSNFKIVGGTATPTGTQEGFDNSFDQTVEMAACMKWERNLFLAPLTATSPIVATVSNFAQTFASNLLRKNIGAAGVISFPAGSALVAAGGSKDIVLLLEGAGGNPQGLSTNSPANSDVIFDGWFVDAGGATATTPLVGDALAFKGSNASGSYTCTWRNCIGGPTPAGRGFGKLASVLGPPSGTGSIHAIVEHCSHFTDGGDGPANAWNSECPLFQHSEATTGTSFWPDHVLSSFKSNLGYTPAAATGLGGSLFSRYGILNFTSEFGDPAGFTKNGGIRLKPAGTDPYGLGSGLTGANTDFPNVKPESPINVDPQLVDPFRTIATWDTSLGGPGTVAHALAELSKRYDPESTWDPRFSFDAYLAYLRGGWVPKAAAYFDSHDKAAPTTAAGGWIGAVAGIELPDASMRIPMVGRRFIAGTADTLSYVGVPLRPGKLFPADVTAGKGRPMLNGAEIRCVLTPVTEPGNLNEDGSLKSILGQFLMPTMAQNIDVVGEFRCDELRTLPALTYDDPVTGTLKPLISPAAAGPGGEKYDVYYVTPGVYVPSDPKDLCDSGMFGLYIRPESEDPLDTTGAALFAKVNSQIITNFIGTPGGTAWAGAQNDRFWYYDPLMEYFTMWARKGDLRFLQHGYARYARARYLYYNFNGTVQFLTDEPHHPTKGFGLARWLLGDVPAVHGADYWGTRQTHTGFKEFYQMDLATALAYCGQRGASNRMRDVVWQYLHGITVDQFGLAITPSRQIAALMRFINDPSITQQPTPTWGEITLEWDGSVIDRIPRQQFALGSTPVMIHMVFQGALECDALIEWYDRMPLAAGGQDPRIITAVKTIVDFWFAHCKYPPPGPPPDPEAGRGTYFHFATSTYDGPPAVGSGGSPSLGNDLNGFHIPICYWLAGAMRDVQYINKGDELLDAHTRTPQDGVTGPFVHNTINEQSAKQMIEWGYSLLDGLGMRNWAMAQIAAGPTQAPTIVLTPSTPVTFNATAGTANPAEQDVVVTNSGTGLLSGLEANVVYGPEGTGWLSALLDGTLEGATLRLNATTGSLVAGNYTAQVTVESSAPGVTNSPQSFAVTFVVVAAPAPSIGFTPPGEIVIDTTVGTPNPILFSKLLKNGGTGTLDNLTVAVDYLGGTPGWLVASLDAPVAATVARGTATVGALGVGSYFADIVVSSTAVGVTNSPQRIHVVLNVNEPSVLGSFPLRLAGKRSAAIMGGGV